MWHWQKCTLSALKRSAHARHISGWREEAYFANGHALARHPVGTFMPLQPEISTNQVPIGKILGPQKLQINPELANAQLPELTTAHRELIAQNKAKREARECHQWLLRSEMPLDRKELTAEDEIRRERSSANARLTELSLRATFSETSEWITEILDEIGKSQDITYLRLNNNDKSSTSQSKSTTAGLKDFLSSLPIEAFKAGYRVKTSDFLSKVSVIDSSIEFNQKDIQTLLEVIKNLAVVPSSCKSNLSQVLRLYSLLPDCGENGSGNRKQDHLKTLSLFIDAASHIGDGMMVQIALQLLLTRALQLTGAKKSLMSGYLFQKFDVLMEDLEKGGHLELMVDVSSFIFKKLPELRSLVANEEITGKSLADQSLDRIMAYRIFALAWLGKYEEPSEIAKFLLSQQEPRINRFGDNIAHLHRIELSHPNTIRKIFVPDLGILITNRIRRLLLYNALKKGDSQQANALYNEFESSGVDIEEFNRQLIKVFRVSGSHFPHSIAPYNSATNYVEYLALELQKIELAPRNYILEEEKFEKQSIKSRNLTTATLNSHIRTFSKTQNIPAILRTYMEFAKDPPSFETIPTNNPQPDVMTFELMIKCASMMTDIDAVAFYSSEMERFGLKMSLEAQDAIIDGFARLDVDATMRLLLRNTSFPCISERAIEVIMPYLFLKRGFGGLTEAVNALDNCKNDKKAKFDFDRLFDILATVPTKSMSANDLIGLIYNLKKVSANFHPNIQTLLHVVRRFERQARFEADKHKFSLPEHKVISNNDYVQIELPNLDNTVDLIVETARLWDAPRWRELVSDVVKNNCQQSSQDSVECFKSLARYYGQIAADEKMTKSILHRAQQKGHALPKDMWRSYLRALLEKGKLEEAMQQMEEWRQNGIQIDFTFYQILLRGLPLSTRLDKYLHILGLAKDAGYPPDDTMKLTALRKLAANNDVTSAMVFLQRWPFSDSAGEFAIRMAIYVVMRAGRGSQPILLELIQKLRAWFDGSSLARSYIHPSTLPILDRMVRECFNCEYQVLMGIDKIPCYVARQGQQEFLDSLHRFCQDSNDEEIQDDLDT